MIYYNTFFIISFLLSIFYVYRFQKHFDVNITAIFLLIPVVNLGYIFMAKASNLDQALVANRIIYLGGCFLPYFITFSIFNLCKIEVKPWIRTILIMLNSSVYVCVLLVGRNKLFYESVVYKYSKGVAYMEKEYGPVHTVFILMLAFYILIGTGTIVYTYFKKKEVSRVMLYLLFLPEFFSVIGYFGGKLLGMVYELSPVTFVIAQLVYLFISRRLSFYKVSDMAIDTLLMNGRNGYVMMDLKHHYLGSNLTAKEIFPSLKNVPVDDNLEEDEILKEYFVKWVDAFSTKGNSEEFYVKKNDEDEDNNQYYTIEIDYLYNEKSKIGYQIFLKDDTDDIKYIKLLNNYRAELSEEVEAKTARIVQMHNNLILSMATMVESRDNSTGGHIKRTSDCIRILIDEIRKDNKLKLSDEFCRNLIKAAPMHDLGKIAVPDNILKLERRYEPEEFEKMKSHAAEGAKIVHNILKDTDDDAFHVLAENVAHYHHERFDGSGYPDGLKGEEIPIEARIMAIADVYDALVSKRCYKESMSFEDADRIIMEGMGTHFDPQLKDYYVKARPRLEEYYKAETEKVVKNEKKGDE